MAVMRDVEETIFALAPKELAMEWDNVGLLVGHAGREVSKLLVALDVTERVAEEAIELGANLIVSHHPVMNCAWSPVQSVRDDNPQGRLLLRLIESGVGCVCMHTNLDAAEGGVNDALAARLGLADTEKLAGGDGILRAGSVAEQNCGSFAAFVKAALGAGSVRFVDTGRPIRKVAVGGGACGGYFRAAARAGCDALVTADVKYDQFLDAKALGLCLIDAGHFPTENVVCPVLAEYLRKSFPGLEVLVSKCHREVFDCL